MECFLKDYNCLYANDQQMGYDPRLSYFSVDTLFTEYFGFISNKIHRCSSIGKFLVDIGYITHIILSVVVVLLEFH